ncbi:MAG: agmatine deiminase [Bacilli bacterium]|jgi:agmatine deiminase|nr:agmatine deiminase [Bacilli bacterium]
MNSIVKDCPNLAATVFPFEGEKHLATVVELPYREDTWRNQAVPAIKEFLAVVRAISSYEMVVVIADPRIPYSVVRSFEIPNVHILRLAYDDSWARDNLPVFLKGAEDSLVGVDYGFNAWGGTFNGLYQDWSLDNKLGRELLLELSIPRFAKKDFILEGGSIHTDGKGTLLTTQECLLSKGRNPSLTQEQIEAVLKETLSLTKVIWLPYGVEQDETSGHVDNMACFLKPGVVGLAIMADPNDPQYARSQADKEVLLKETDSEGNPLSVVDIPMPAPLYLTKEEAQGIKADGQAISRLEGRRLAASYVNFYQGEKFVLVPQFGVAEDQPALTLFKSIYPDKDILPIPSREILLGGGNIHCITKQIPFSDKAEIEPKEGEE